MMKAMCDDYHHLIEEQEKTMNVVVHPEF